jgi:hypothetical protein
MALTIDQQANLDVQLALEDARNTNNAAMQAKQTKLEAIRMAKDVLIENARSKPADSREVTAADITAFAATLVAAVNA